jgi:hypothetical protein
MMTDVEAGFAGDARKSTWILLAAVYGDRILRFRNEDRLGVSINA